MTSRKLLLLFFICIQWSGLDCKFDRRDGDELFYYSESTQGSSFEATKNFCEKIGGHIPSIHGPGDAKFIFGLSSFGTCVWLAGVKSNDSYAWEDGTEFDYPNWIPNEPSCQSDCCAVCMETNVMKSADLFKLKSQDCATNGRQVCRIDISEPRTKEILVNSWSLFNEGDHATLSAILFSDLLNGMSNLNDTIIMTQMNLNTKFAQMEEDMENVRQSVRKARETLTDNSKRIRDLDRELQSSTDMLTQMITSANESMWESFSDFNNSTGARIDALTNTVNDAVDEFDVRIGEVEMNLTTAVTTLKDQVDSSVEELRLRVERYRDQVNHSLEAHSNSMNKWTTNIETELRIEILAIDAKVENYTSTFKSELQTVEKEQACDTLKTQLEEMRGTLEKLSKHLQDVEQQLQELKDETSEEVTEESESESKHAEKDKKGWWTHFVPSRFGGHYRGYG